MTSAVTHRRLGRTDLEISPIGIGTMQMANRGMVTAAYPSITADASAAVVRAAIDGGVNWFDTAEMYGRGESERALTTALRTAGANPGDVLVATKWGRRCCAPPRASGTPSTPGWPRCRATRSTSTRSTTRTAASPRSRRRSGRWRSWRRTAGSGPSG
nr:aldo/keto reductase [Fodinicola feengrottensis]